MNPTETLRLLERHGLRPSKHLGQHFLADDNIVSKIVGLVDEPPRSVLEIGAGLGALTRGLAAAGFGVRAYEVDGRLEPALLDVLGGFDVDLRFEDATAVDFSTDLENGRWAMASNLPYNVGTTILLDLVRQVHQIDQFVVMIQSEVADRLVASTGSKVYGIPSVVAQLYTVPGATFTVPPQVFVPPPAVESTVLELRRRSEIDELADAAIALAARAFGQRRKMLRKSLGLPDDVFDEAGLDPRQRPETVTPELFVALARAAT